MNGHRSRRAGFFPLTELTGRRSSFSRYGCNSRRRESVSAGRAGRGAPCGILARHRQWGEIWMSEKTFSRIIAFTALILASIAAGAQGAAAHLTIQADKQVSPVS